MPLPSVKDPTLGSFTHAHDGARTGAWVLCFPSLCSFDLFAHWSNEEFRDGNAPYRFNT